MTINEKSTRSMQAEARRTAKRAFDQREQELVGLRERVKGLEAENASLGTSLTANATELAAVRRALSERGFDVNALKAELARELLRSARLQGYVDRALEDDAVREGKTRDVIETRSRLEPLRDGPAPVLVQRDFGRGDEAEGKPWFQR